MATAISGAAQRATEISKALTEAGFCVRRRGRVSVDEYDGMDVGDDKPILGYIETGIGDVQEIVAQYTRRWDVISGFL